MATGSLLLFGIRCKSTAFLGHYRYIFIARLKLSHTISNYLMIANGHKKIASQNEVLFVSSSMAV